MRHILIGSSEWMEHTKSKYYWISKQNKLTYHISESFQPAGYIEKEH